MEDVSFLLSNNSDNSTGNSSLLGEFPYWQPTLTISLFFLTIVPFGPIIVLYLPLVVVLVSRMLKKDHFKALNSIPLSLVIASIVEDICRILLYPVYLPSVFRYCVCSCLISTTLAAVFIFFLIYRPFCFAALSVLQLLVIVGKKKFVTLKVSCGMIAACIGLGIIYVASILKPVYETNEKTYCYENHCPNGRSDTLFGTFITVFFSIIFIAYIPTLAVVTTMSTWSCAVFKKYYTGGDDQLNRRMISLPFIMPLANVSSAVLEGALAVSVGNALSMISVLGDQFPYWSNFINTILLIILRFSIRLVYPLILFYTHTKLRKAVKRLLHRLKNRNRVAPGVTNSDTSQNTN